MQRWREKKARIVAKMNAITDPDIIKALYGASMAGVKIDLIIRGICCLRPGMAGVSEKYTSHICDRSLPGTFTGVLFPKLRSASLLLQRRLDGTQSQQQN